jgi:hypothetical protein
MNNGGASWVSRNTGINVGIDGVYFLNSSEGWAVGNFGAVFHTTNGGVTWASENSGTSNELNDVFFVDASHGWSVGANGTVLFRSTPTEVGDASSTVLPTDVTLGQNYPNPFNPSTNISYRLSRPGFVSLKVYNLLGQEVATLVSRSQPTGEHDASFDAAGLPSGIYLYKLDLNNGTVKEVRKMTVLK